MTPDTVSHRLIWGRSFSPTGPCIETSSENASYTSISAEPSSTEVHLALLAEVPRPYIPSTSFWGRHRFQVIAGGTTLILLVTLLVLRMIDKIHGSCEEGFADLTIGSTLFSLVQIFSKEKHIRKVERTFDTLAQPMLFSCSQAFSNTDSPGGKEISISLINASAGFFLISRLGRVYRNWFLRYENRIEHQGATPAAHLPFIMSHKLYIYGGLSCFTVASLLAAALSKDPLAKTFLVTLSSYWGSQILGYKASQYLDQITQQREREEVPLNRKAKIAQITYLSLKTFGPILIAGGFIPFSIVSSHRSSILPVFAGLIGFIHSCLEEVQRVRVEENDPNDLSELQDIEQLESLDLYRNPSRISPKALRTIYEVLSLGGISGFCLWQIIESKDWLIRGPMFALWTGHASSFLLTRRIDDAWSLDESIWSHYADHPCRNYLFYRSVISPSIFFMHPAFLYYFVAVLAQMNDEAIGEQDISTQVLVILAWFFYGTAMGNEGGRFLRREGSFFSFPTLYFLNALLTFYKKIDGRLDKIIRQGE